ncbi:hypothetical protein H0H92_013169 [Tricholoma furcatifolium]|nr:hypothetical protein H0H92_013169 [Tricholoma furcatifolium]
MNFSDSQAIFSTDRGLIEELFGDENATNLAYNSQLASYDTEGYVLYPASRDPALPGPSHLSSSFTSSYAQTGIDQQILNFWKDFDLAKAIQAEQPVSSYSIQCPQEANFESLNQFSIPSMSIPPVNIFQDDQGNNYSTEVSTYLFPSLYLPAHPANDEPTMSASPVSSASPTDIAAATPSSRVSRARRSRASRASRGSRGPRRPVPSYLPRIRHDRNFINTGVLCDITFECQWGACRGTTVFQLTGHTEADEVKFQQDVFEHLDAHAKGKDPLQPDGTSSPVDDDIRLCQWGSCDFKRAEGSKTRGMLRHLQTHLEWYCFCSNSNCNYLETRATRPSHRCTVA